MVIISFERADFELQKRASFYCLRS